MDVWVIAGSVLASCLANVLIGWWNRSHSNDRDLGRFEEKFTARDLSLAESFKNRDELRKVELRGIEHRLNYLEARLKELGQRYHDLRGPVSRREKGDGDG